MGLLDRIPQSDLLIILFFCGSLLWLTLWLQGVEKRRKRVPSLLPGECEGGNVAEADGEGESGHGLPTDDRGMPHNQATEFQKSVDLLEQALKGVDSPPSPSPRKPGSPDQIDLTLGALGQGKEQAFKTNGKVPWRKIVEVRASLSRTREVLLKAAIGLDASPSATKYLSSNVFPLVGSLVANSVSGWLKVLAVVATALFTGFSIFMISAVIIANRRRMRELAQSTTDVLGLARHYLKYILLAPTPRGRRPGDGSYLLKPSPDDSYLPNLEFFGAAGTRKTPFRHIRSQALESSLAEIAKLVSDALHDGGALDGLRKACTSELSRRALDGELGKVYALHRAWQVNTSNSPFMDHDLLFDEIQDVPFEAHELLDMRKRLKLAEAPLHSLSITDEASEDEQVPEEASMVSKRTDGVVVKEGQAKIMGEIDLGEDGKSMTPFETLKSLNAEKVAELEHANALHGTPEGHQIMSQLLCRGAESMSGTREISFPSMLSLSMFIDPGDGQRPLRLVKNPKRRVLNQDTAALNGSEAESPSSAPKNVVEPSTTTTIVEMVDMVEYYASIVGSSSAEQTICARQSLLWLCQFHWSVFLQIIADEEDLDSVCDSIESMVERLLPNGADGARELLDGSVSDRLKDEVRQRMSECTVLLHRKALIEMIHKQDLKQAEQDLTTALEIAMLRYGDPRSEAGSELPAFTVACKVVSAILHVLAMVKEQQHYLNEAIRLYRESLSLILPTSHSAGEEVEHEMAIRSSKTIHQLAGAYAQKGCYEEATRLYEYCQEMKIGLFGWNHLSTANTLHLYGWTKEMQGQYWEALKAYEEALEICQDRFSWGYKDPDCNKEVLSTPGAIKEMALHKALGLLKAKQGFEKGAQDSFDRAYVISLRMFGKGHAYSRKLATLKNISLQDAISPTGRKAATASATAATISATGTEARRLQRRTSIGQHGSKGPGVPGKRSGVLIARGRRHGRMRVVLSRGRGVDPSPCVRGGVKAGFRVAL